MKTFFSRKIVLIASAVLLVVIAGTPAVYFYRQYTAMKKEVAAVKTKQEDPKALVAMVAKHILLPTGEDPTIMTVTDKEKLSGQLFFANAKNGDKVLIYQKAKKAFLYDPVADLVIEVGPVLTASASGTLASSGSAPSASTVPPTPTVQASYTFALLNATQISGLAKTYEAKLLSAVSTAHVVALGNAKGDYRKSFLVDVTGTHAAVASVVSQSLSLTVAPLPAGESTPSADFLIILGTDQK